MMRPPTLSGSWTGMEWGALRCRRVYLDSHVSDRRAFQEDALVKNDGPRALLPRP